MMREESQNVSTEAKWALEYQPRAAWVPSLVDSAVQGRILQSLHLQSFWRDLLLYTDIYRLLKTFLLSSQRYWSRDGGARHDRDRAVSVVASKIALISLYEHK